MSLNLEPVAGTETLFGKSVSDLQTNVAISNGSISGTSNYVTGYTGFSGIVAEQSGNYIAVKATAVDGATIVFNGASNVTLDSDGMIVIRLRDGVQKLRFTATKGDITEVAEYSLSNLTIAVSSEE